MRARVCVFVCMNVFLLVCVRARASLHLCVRACVTQSKRCPVWCNEACWQRHAPN